MFNATKEAEMLKPLEKAIKLPKSYAFCGEFQSGKDYVGHIFKVDGGYKVVSISDGVISAESDLLPASFFKRAGGLNVSASRYVKFYTAA
jgi:hypothetical protein